MRTLGAIKFICLIVLISLFSSCKQRRRWFPPIDKFTSFYQEKSGLAVTVKALSKSQAYEYFGFDVQSEGYRPLQVRIKNHTSSTFVLRPSYHDFACVSGKHIAKHMHYDTFHWMTYLTLPAIYFFWPLIPIAIIPAGLGMKAYNKKTTRDMRKMTLSNNESLEVLPYETVSKFIFVQENSYRAHFDLSFFNIDNKSLITYDVKV